MGTWPCLSKVAAGGAAWLLVGCAPAPAAPAAPTGGPSAAPAAPAASEPARPQPKAGGVLVYSCTTAPVNLNPYVSAGPAEERTVGVVYESLVAWKHEKDIDYRIDYEVVPWLVERWESPDPTTFLLHLRKGVKWHDGEEFTAQDVEFSLQFARDPANKFRVANTSFVHVDTVQAVDRYTVRMTFKSQVPNILTSLADRIAVILPKHLADRGDDFKKGAIGTGPFKLKDYDPNQGALLTKNTEYWQPGRPYLDGVRCIYGMQAQLEAAAFTAGQLDVLNVNDRKQIETLQRSVPGLQHGSVVSDNGLSIILKLNTLPFSDARVRKAVHLAVDRQGLQAAALFGDGVILPPGMPGDKVGWAIPQEELLKLPGYRQPKDVDLAEAKRLLAEAGHPGGIKTSLLYGTNLTLGVRIAEPLQAQLAKAGIDVTLRPLPIAEARAAEEKGEFEMLLQNAADHQLNKKQFDMLYSKGNHYNGIDDPKLDGMLERMTRLPDINARKQAGLEMQRYLLETNHIVPTIDPLVFPMWQRWVFDYVFEPDNVNRITRSQGYRLWMDTSQMPADRRS